MNPVAARELHYVGVVMAIATLCEEAHDAKTIFNEREVSFFRTAANGLTAIASALKQRAHARQDATLN